jgi:hypothetical protein
MFNLFICNVRSGIFAFLAGLVALFARTSVRSKLILFSFILIFLLIGLDTSIFGKYQPFVDSIVYFSDAGKKIGGSSFQTRLSQLEGAINIWISGGLIFGKGFGWCANYYETKGDHPVLFGFESVIYRILIDSGVIGIILWSWLFYSFFHLNYSVCFNPHPNFNISYRIIESLIVSFITFLIVTGVFGLNYFLIILVLVIKECQFKNVGSLSYT